MSKSKGSEKGRFVSEEAINALRTSYERGRTAEAMATVAMISGSDLVLNKLVMKALQIQKDARDDLIKVVEHILYPNSYDLPSLHEDRVQRCAECDCKHGGNCCNWIKGDGPCEQCGPHLAARPATPTGDSAQ